MKVWKVFIFIFLIIFFYSIKNGFSGTTIKTDLGTITMGGYAETMVGVRTTDENIYRPGTTDKVTFGQGMLTMFRTTVQPEVLIRFPGGPRLFYAGRFVKEGQYTVEDRKRRIQGLKDFKGTFYDEYDYEAIRELYLDVDPTSTLNLRIGRQFIIWGETDVFRMLDILNPQDSRWNVPSLFPLEETRLPMWGVKAMLTIPRQLQNDFLELVYIPAIDDLRKDTGIAPGQGRWAVHPEDRFSQGRLALLSDIPYGFPQISRADFGAIMTGPLGPRGFIPRTEVSPKHLENGRIGIRYSTIVGRTQLTIGDFYGHYTFSPLPLFFEGFRRDPVTGRPIAANLVFKTPRQNVAAFSFNTTSDYLKATIRGEFSYRFNRPFNTFNPYSPNGIVKKDVFSYSLGFDRPTFIPFLHPDDPARDFFISLQLFQDIIMGNDNYLHVSAFKTDIDRVSTYLTARIATGYKNDIWKPTVTMAYDPENNGLLNLSCSWNPPWNENLKAEVTYLNFWGKDDYRFLGLWRERDSVFLKIRYTW
jgi:hypothetical protein